MIDGYKVIKPLNNNVVVTERYNKIFILSGKGIGFGRKKGEIISEQATIEQKFIQIDEKEIDSYKNVLENIDEDILAVTEEIIDMASNKLEEELNSHIHIGLADHINFALKRLKEGIDIINPFLYEIKTLYSDEYAIGEKTLEIIKERLNVQLPESEIGFIALHIYSAKMNVQVSDSLKITRIVKEVIEFISDRLDIKLNDKTLEYSRLISHLRYALYRIDHNKSLENMFLPSVKKQLKKEFKISKEVCEFIEKRLEKKVPEDEVGYIAVHIHRLIESN
ncbi:PRD domain-containing protein [Clostridium rectalis]|uniref:PRD domain-containing protein n=1 Tax=Clostridium rectalis TaxID=2040295 RepID=UPI000F631B71|nr:PRD domain-containing protein [Clostridium rectalis]